MAAVLILGSLLLCAEGLTRRPRTREAFSDLLMTGFCVSYVGLHWLIAFPTWRRYLLPVIPPATVLLARIAQRIGSIPRVPLQKVTHGWLPAALLVGVLLVPAVEASAGQSPIAESRAAYAGVDDVAAFFSSVEEGSVVYHHWLGWHYHFTLFDGPVYLSYWPTPAWLARDVQAFGIRDPRYIVFPAWESRARVEEALTAVGYALRPVLARPETEGAAFNVYRIVPREDT
jgi:hypothetical protein